MSKCGIIDMDPRSRKLKVKLYRDGEGNVKGDGRCCYAKVNRNAITKNFIRRDFQVESVELSLKILDGYRLRNAELKVERAHFEQKGEYDPSKKKRKLSAKEIKKFKEGQERSLRETKGYFWFSVCTHLSASTIGCSTGARTNSEENGQSPIQQ